MSFAPFKEGVERTTRDAPYELLALPPESPIPPWSTPGYALEDWYTPPRALLLFAHPDDETLFAGGLMLRYPEWQWRLVCMTGIDERQEELDHAVSLYRQAGVNIVSSLSAELPDRYKPSDRAMWLREVQDQRSQWETDIVFTHGYRGEYGHHHHIWCNLAVHMIFDNVWDFLSPCWRVKQLAKTIVREVPTTHEKRRLFETAYGRTAQGLFENAPWITDMQMNGWPEYFTQGVLGV